MGLARDPNTPHSLVSEQFFLLLLNFPLVSSSRHPLIQHQHYLIPNLEQCLPYPLQKLPIHLSLLHQDHKYEQCRHPLEVRSQYLQSLLPYYIAQYVHG
ncbi:hypothetical protein OIU74_026141 [Salix koriyanagi]|uniref:Uncharacterized protein n=1 Tax=Salix koriyanagi TaxID=2511006 RepID=A0A9Q1A6D8_9ROSI|nr:hypothetical protein OIU74_026141 [Salix koriyanagi]